MSMGIGLLQSLKCVVPSQLTHAPVQQSLPLISIAWGIFAWLVDCSRPFRLMFVTLSTKNEKRDF